ncbi:MAG: VanZ family protein [Saccharofermentans sp.]|nr:VanZ family protein [Saccharofermentans sp.]
MKTKEIISILLTVTAFAVYIITFGQYGKKVLFILLFLTVIFAYIAVRFHMRRIPDSAPKTVRRFIWFCFLLFIHLLLSFTLTSSYFYRPSSFAFTDPEGFNVYLQNRVNLIPFYTIREISDKSSFYTVIINNIGNIVALMPMGVFLPLLFFRQRRIKMFIMTTTFAVILIESTQMLFLMGAWDIDDLILNVTGAVIMFLIMRSRLAKKMFEMLFPGVPYEVR